MAIICDNHDLFFAHVPRTGGTFVSSVLTERLDGRVTGATHATFRSLELEPKPSIRIFAVREPVAWYRSYWAHGRAATKHPRAWPIWGEAGGYPTRRLDERCGAPTFEDFVRNVLRHFPNGFVRAMYCDYLNGSTHALRTEHLQRDLTRLLNEVGVDQVPLLEDRSADGARHEHWLARAGLPRPLEHELRAIENLDDLEIPYV